MQGVICESSKGILFLYIKALVYALYLIRKRAKDNHEAAVSNAIFYASIFLLINFTVIITSIMYAINYTLDDWWFEEFYGVSLNAALGVLGFLLIWGCIKFYIKSPTSIEINNLVDQFPVIQKQKEIISFLPLIFTFILILLYLITSYIGVSL